MKEMSKVNKFKRGTMTVEIQSHIPEKFLNLAWKNNIQIKNIRKRSITTIVMDINLKDFSLIEDIAQKTKSKIKIVNRKGVTFFLLKIRRRFALVGGVFIFVFILYFLSGFIWTIDIQTENNLSPYEIRQQLINYGVMPGIRKSKVNVYQLQDNMIKSNENIMYFNARVDGSRLYVKVIDKVTPPSIITDNEPCNLVAKKDGQIVRVYTSAGSPTVKKGDTVKAGDIIVKGEQGKEGSTYTVHASGNVIARTFYEQIKEVPIKGVKKERTENKIENLYIEVLGKKIYFKNSINKFKSYDKIVENSGFIKKEIYYEVKETKYNMDSQKVVDSTAEELYSKIVQSLDKSIKVVDKQVQSEPNGDNVKVRVLVVAEENIALAQKLQ
ncbi:sporulation protein YqfD [Clostridium sp. YIM B02515]|uniref:Sporulation protein YqfD n=1 Tax=Clostridium rhizosphaerae TaxID=2803861 RepID=A0ABS1TAY7_9CLOT|nr:sporulation protein YqfD [Clostridium rhizosphaerae]MBL4935168.1 sporulation protein YqfD [Clostridium rhizosphaerae]